MSRGAEATVIGQGLQGIFLKAVIFLSNYAKFDQSRTCSGHDHGIHSPRTDNRQSLLK